MYFTFQGWQLQKWFHSSEAVTVGVQYYSPISYLPTLQLLLDNQAKVLPIPPENCQIPLFCANLWCIMPIHCEWTHSILSKSKSSKVDTFLRFICRLVGIHLPIMIVLFWQTLTLFHSMLLLLFVVVVVMSAGSGEVPRGNQRRGWPESLADPEELYRRLRLGQGTAHCCTLLLFTCVTAVSMSPASSSANINHCETGLQQWCNDGDRKLIIIPIHYRT